MGCGLCLNLSALFIANESLENWPVSQECQSARQRRKTTTAAKAPSWHRTAELARRPCLACGVAGVAQTKSGQPAHPAHAHGHIPTSISGSGPPVTSSIGPYSNRDVVLPCRAVHPVRHAWNNQGNCPCCPGLDRDFAPPRLQDSETDCALHRTYIHPMHSSVFRLCVASPSHPPASTTSSQTMGFRKRDPETGQPLPWLLNTRTFLNHTCMFISVPLFAHKRSAPKIPMST